MVERAYAAHQRQPHQQHSQWQDDKLWDHHTFDNFGGQRRAFPQRLCHLQQHGWAVRVVTLQPHIGDPHIVAAHHVVAHFRHAQVGVLPGACLGQWQVTFTRNGEAFRAQHLVVHQVGLIRAHQVSCFSRKCKVNALVVKVHQLRHSAQVVFQRAVIGLGGNALCNPPRERQAERPEQQQWREHPVQNFAKQAALLALEQAKRKA